MSPEQDHRRADAHVRFRRLMRYMLLLAAAAVALALFSFSLFGIPLTLHLAIATTAGVGLSVLVGTGLMGLAFLSASSGHDDDAATDHKDKRPK